MKKHYFMNKPEVVEAEEYENPDGYVQYYYSREERINNRRKDYTPSKPRVFPFIGKGKKGTGSGKRLLYVIDVLLIIGMLIYWRNFDRFNHPEELTQNDIKYYLKMSPSNESDRELFIYAENISKKPMAVNKILKLKFFKVDSENNHNYLNAVDVTLDKKLNSGESKNLYVYQYSKPLGDSIRWLGVELDGEKIYQVIKINKE